MEGNAELSPAVCFSGVGHVFASVRGTVTALQNIELTLTRGEFVFLLGPSGCGKSTLLRLAAGLQNPTSGSITFPGWKTRPKIRLVFQDHSLLPWLSVVDNAALGLEMDGIRRHQRRTRALGMLDSLGVARFANHYPHELSGGMKQRVAIARAFVTEPDILLMDEPFRTLDAPLRLLIQEQLEGLWLEKHPTILFVTHEIDEAVLLGDRVVVMGGRPGHILQEYPLPFPRPRNFSGATNPSGEEVRWKIWSQLKSEVQRLSVE